MSWFGIQRGSSFYTRGIHGRSGDSVYPNWNWVWLPRFNIITMTLGVSVLGVHVPVKWKSEDHDEETWFIIPLHTEFAV